MELVPEFEIYRYVPGHKPFHVGFCDDYEQADTLLRLYTRHRLRGWSYRIMRVGRWGVTSEDMNPKVGNR